MHFASFNTLRQLFFLGICQLHTRAEQRIAWDPSAKKIRSWVFISDGSFVEGSWHKEGNAWVVRTSGVLPDGGESSSLNLWVADGPDSCWFKAVKPIVDGQEIDDLMVEFKRKTESR